MSGRKRYPLQEEELLSIIFGSCSISHIALVAFLSFSARPDLYLFLHSVCLLGHAESFAVPLAEAGCASG